MLSHNTIGPKYIPGTVTVKTFCLKELFWVYFKQIVQTKTKPENIYLHKKTCTWVFMAIISVFVKRCLKPQTQHFWLIAGLSWWPQRADLAEWGPLYPRRGAQALNQHSWLFCQWIILCTASRRSAISSSSAKRADRTMSVMGKWPMACRKKGDR